MAPVEAPWQRTLVLDEVALIAAGSVKVVENEAVHALASVIVTEYVPAARPVKSSVVALLDQS